jgi:hypothetical protein
MGDLLWKSHFLQFRLQIFNRLKVDAGWTGSARNCARHEGTNVCISEIDAIALWVNMKVQVPVIHNAQ